MEKQELKYRFLAIYLAVILTMFMDRIESYENCVSVDGTDSDVVSPEMNYRCLLRNFFPRQVRFCLSNFIISNIGDKSIYAGFFITMKWKTKSGV